MNSLMFPCHPSLPFVPGRSRVTNSQWLSTSQPGTPRFFQSGLGEVFHRNYTGIGLHSHGQQKSKKSNCVDDMEYSLEDNPSHHPTSMTGAVQMQVISDHGSENPQRTKLPNLCWTAIAWVHNIGNPFAWFYPSQIFTKFEGLSSSSLSKPQFWESTPRSMCIFMYILYNNHNHTKIPKNIPIVLPY
jgi:hypothetical protein